MEVGSTVKPGVGVTVGNIWEAPTQEVLKIVTKINNVIDKGNLVILILIQCEYYARRFKWRTSMTNVRVIFIQGIYVNFIYDWFPIVPPSDIYLPD